MFNRRDLLKCFAAGTIITPAGANNPIARLIEVPSIDLVTADRIPEPIDLSEVKAFTLTFEMQDGSRRSVSSIQTFSGQGVIRPERVQLELRFGTIATSSPMSTYRTGSIYADIGPASSGETCHFCKSLITGKRCESCGAPRTGK